MVGLGAGYLFYKFGVPYFHAYVWKPLANAFSTKPELPPVGPTAEEFCNNWKYEKNPDVERLCPEKPLPEIELASPEFENVASPVHPDQPLAPEPGSTWEQRYEFYGGEDGVMSRVHVFTKNLNEHYDYKTPVNAQEAHNIVELWDLIHTAPTRDLEVETICFYEYFVRFAEQAGVF